MAVLPYETPSKAADIGVLPHLLQPHLPNPSPLIHQLLTPHSSGELINGEIYKGPTPTTHGPKLGPKANQGAINAGLRALDRTGKPCRKWERKGFSVKSFTGVVWEAPTWRAPKKAVNLDANGEVQSDASSEVKGEGEAQMASVVQSENGTSGSNAETPGMVGGFTSSPAPVAAA
ncbi:DUF1711-domain-containing protein [Eremomyces bilateralis CBS 781.70]|uniref:DUF1711-domain-containing protein n=1 Tax=Eremomyces bilateralis CBS 781.70 TaxID=1392243 RepID=A0A6G1G770_9PEZI|nr:DUF1711-domain-containing protein [Eremomyces bilateralis CBS 781.70]KAF1813679.1 DUF1711-domain-containing protein [Eremomyces bilateralis CBS 781.70]